MFDPCTSANTLGWRTVSNQFATRTLDDLSTHILKPVKIRRRTRILNRELTKFARLRSYSQYVEIKTKILKKVSDASIEDEQYSTDSSEDEESPSREPLSLSTDDESALSRTASRKLVGRRSEALKHVQKARQAIRTVKKEPVGGRSRTSKHVQKSAQATRMANEELVGECSNTSKHVQERPQPTSARKRACVRRNLTSLLDNVESTNHLAGRANTVRNPEDDDAKNNKESPKETTMERTTVQIPNVPTGDSGIDDDSQDNSSTNNRENDDAMELENIAETSNNDRRLEDSQTVVEAPNETTSDGEGSAPMAVEEEHEEGAEQEEAMKEGVDEEKSGREEPTEEKMEEEAIEEEKMEDEVIEEEAKEKEELEVEEKEKEELKLEDKEMEKVKKKKKEKKLEEEEKDEEKKEQEEEEKENEKVKKKKKEKLEEEEKEKVKKKKEEKLEEEQKDEEKKEQEEEEKEKEKVKKKKKKKKLKEEEKHEEEEKEKDEDTLHFDTNDELSKKKCQPIIKCTEIVTSKYTIIREEGDDLEDEAEEKGQCTEQTSPEHHIDHTLEESTESGGKSPESKRVNQLKRMNLFCSGSESDSSESDENVDATRNPSLRNASRPSQVISEFSDSEYHSDSSSFRITDSDDSATARIPCRHDQDEGVSRKTGFPAKSIKDQIEKQDIADSAMLVERENAAVLGEKENEEIDSSKASCSGTSGNVGDERWKEKRRGPSRAQSRQNTFINIPDTCFDEKELAACAENTRDPLELSPNGDVSMSRPIELADFVARQGLIPSCELSTITTKDIPTRSDRQENDENIWLMEIPRSIITDPELCGKSMLIEKGNIRIGEVNYETTLRHDKIVSCILRSRRKKARYKTVNIKPVRSINIRHERVESESFSVTQAPPSPSSVPFPKNLKVRNPLTMKKECRASSTKSTHRNAVKKKEKQQKTKKLKKGIWNMDHFISKSKKHRADGS